MLAVKLLLTVVAGMAAHTTRPALQARLGQGWLELVCYTVGVVLALPFVLLVHEELDIENTMHSVIVAYLLAFGCVGAGVGASWFLEEYEVTR